MFQSPKHIIIILLLIIIVPFQNFPNYFHIHLFIFLVLISISIINQLSLIN